METLENANGKKALLTRLRTEIMSLQGFGPPIMGITQASVGLGPIESAFPHGVFPKVGLHEFLSTAPEQSTATSGFIAALLSQFMKGDGLCLWVSTKRTIYPLALSQFGISPDRVIFIDLKKDKDLLWGIEEALKCKALTAVIGELKDLNLTESRRLQLAVEGSKVTGFLHRVCPRMNNPIASLCRWQISHLPSNDEADLPGLGSPRWNVKIEKVRNGIPGSWQLKWNEDHFEHVYEQQTAQPIYASKVG